MTPQALSTTHQVQGVASVTMFGSVFHIMVIVLFVMKRVLTSCVGCVESHECGEPVDAGNQHTARSVNSMEQIGNEDINVQAS